VSEPLDTRVDLGGIALRNPVLTASGTFGYGSELAAFLDLRRIGGFVAKSLTLEPRIGNPPPRIAEAPSGMLNAISLENVGVDAFIDEKLPAIPEGVMVIASVFETDIERYAEVCKRLSREFGLHVFSSFSHPGMALGRVYTGAEAPSRRQPSSTMRAYLDQHAQRIRYLCLHGYLAVDGVEYVIRRMQEMASETHSFILDMNQVSGISQSAARLLNQARLGFAEDGIAVVCSRIHDRPAIIEPMSKSTRKGDRGFLSFEDNDLAVEWCENRLLGEASLAPVASGATASLAQSALFKGLPECVIKQVEAASATRVYASGERVLEFDQGEDGRFFFIESGQVSILVPLQNGGHLRIASLGPGMNFGEMALAGQSLRSASVHAETELRCRILNVDEFNRIADEFPALKVTLLQNLARDLASKLRGATQWIAALA